MFDAVSKKSSNLYLLLNEQYMQTKTQTLKRKTDKKQIKNVTLDTHNFSVNTHQPLNWERVQKNARPHSMADSLKKKCCALPPMQSAVTSCSNRLPLHILRDKSSAPPAPAHFCLVSESWTSAEGRANKMVSNCSADDVALWFRLRFPRRKRKTSPGVCALGENGSASWGSRYCFEGWMYKKRLSPIRWWTFKDEFVAVGLFGTVCGVFKENNM